MKITDRLLFRMLRTALPNPSFPCLRWVNSRQKSSFPNLAGHCCCRIVSNPRVKGCGFFCETWLDPKAELASLSYELENVLFCFVCSFACTFKLLSTILKSPSEVTENRNSMDGQSFSEEQK